MKKILTVIGYSVIALIAGCWVFVPLFCGISWVCKYCGAGDIWAERIALILVTMIVMFFGYEEYESENCSELERKIKEQEQTIQKIKKDAEEILRSEQRKSSEIIQEVCFERDTAISGMEDTAQSSPWLAGKIADIVALIDGEIERDLRLKKRPAIKAAEQVKEISQEKRELVRKYKEMEYQLQFYEGLFPWLEEFKTLPGPEAAAYVQGTDTDYDYVRNWLSPEEYTKLSTAEKNQLALDRYMKRKKSDWDVGIEYERYVGSLYERSGYRVTYNGATQGLSDMGRDIIAVKEDATRVIQCKRWAKEKEIHEKHIFQLYGTTVLMRLEKGTRCVGVFVTTARLSPIAKKCAEFLGIKYTEEFAYKDYPMIKCNVSKTGEKIYHLPFDQQYDRVQISGKDGAMFAWTVEEAEKNGFRRAHRWIPEK